MARDRPQARPRADRRHRDPPARGVQHSALRGRILPRRQRARPAVDDAPRGGGHRRPRGRARAGLTLPGIRELRVRPIVGTLPELSLTGRQWLEPHGSEDSQGRALWALGAVVGRANDPGRRSLAGDLFHGALPATATFTSPRAWAYVLLGIEEYLRAFQGDSTVEALREDLATRLFGLFQRSSWSNWPWFEDSVTYCNARLSQALIVSGTRMHRTEIVDAGLRSLDWLVSLQVSHEGDFAPIGCNGFLFTGRRGGGIRPAARGSLHRDIGLPGRPRCQRRRPLDGEGHSRLRLVPRPERPPAVALRSLHRRLSRRAPCRPYQSKPGGGGDTLVPVGLVRDARGLSDREPEPEPALALQLTT